MEKQNNVPQTGSPALRFPEFEGEWEEKKLGEIALFLDEKRIPLSETERNNRKGKYRYFGASGVIDYVDNYIFDGEYILLGEDGANIITRSTKLAFVVSGKFWVNNHAHVIKAKGSNIFLAEYLETINYEAYNTGTAQPKLNAAICKKIPIKFPSLPEQIKIANFLTSIDTKIQLLIQKKTLLEEYKKGVMQQLFTQMIRFKDENGADYPEWEEKFGGEMFNSISNKNHNSDLPILAITQEHGAIPRHLIDYQISVTEKSVESYKVVEIGDFIISLRSFQGGIEYSSYKGICSPAYIILRPKETISDFFFKCYFKTEYYIKQLNKKLEGIRDGKMVSYKNFSEIPLPFPCIEEQIKIANFLTSIDTKIETVAKQIEQTQAYKKGLLQQLFI